jgi:probable phosphomutase (TIGR03848 family)
MPTLLLIRHGENDFLKQGLLPGRLPGIHLNEKGLAQAEALAAGLGPLPIRAVYASPLERAVETAGPLAGALKLDVQVRPELSDTDVGEWQGRRLKELRKLPLWKQVQKQPSLVRFPGGESFLELQERLVREIDRIRQAHRPKDMLAVVFHSDPIKLVISHYLGLPLDTFQKLGVAAGSVSVLVLDRSRNTLAALNLRPPFSLEK